jgi:dolichol-phosphate mannosyltransferase
VPELSVIVPTYNEADNIIPLAAALETALQGLDWEVIFVDDDSPDGTHAAVRQLGESNPRVRGIRRIGRRGLSSACIEGMLASSARFVAVMDADFQHDETLLPDMLAALRDGSAELVIGSRYIGSGSSREGLSPVRAAGSRLANALAGWISPQRISDPMSGFFMLRRSVVEASAGKLYGKGFKILLDIISTQDKALKVLELPYQMRARAAGDSKLDHAVVSEYLKMLLHRKLGGVVPARFILFVAVGLVGVGVHMATLYITYRLLGQSFPWAQAIATWVAMTGNFFLNNVFTFRDRRLHGVAMLGGLLSFYVACGLGAVINVALASFVFDLGAHWALAGLLGAAAGAVWNYVLSSYLTWRSADLDA